jgi:hypothetical protein
MVNLSIRGHAAQPNDPRADPAFAARPVEDGRYLAGVRLPAFRDFRQNFLADFFAAQILAGFSPEASCWTASSAGASGSACCSGTSGPARPRRRLVAACTLPDRSSGHRGLCGRRRRLSRPTSARLCGTPCGVLGCRIFSGFRRCGVLETACRITDTFRPRNTQAQSRSPYPSQSQLATTCHSLCF